MGIELADKECSELKKILSIDAIGQVFQNRVLDEVKSLKGGMINVNDLNKVVGNMGIKLTEKEHEDLIANLPVDANGKIVLNKLMDGVKTVIGEDIDISDTEGVLENMRIQFSDKERLELLKKLPADGGKIDVGKLDTVLENMGMNLTEKELKDLTRSLQTDVDGKVDMKKVMDEVKAFTGENINNVENVLSDTGIELPETEYAKLMKALPVSGDGKVHKNRTLKGVTSFRRGKVDISNLRPLLEKMDIKLTEKEFEQLNENLPVDGMNSKKVSVNSLSTILDNMGIKLTDEELKDLTQNLPVDEAGKVHINNLDNTLERFGIALTEEELAKLSEDLQIDPNGKVDLKEVMDGVKATTGGEVDVRDVKTTLKNMGIELTDKEYLKLLKNLPFNDDNKVFKNRLLKGVKSFKGGKVNIKNLDTILSNLEIKLADSELKDLTQNIHADVDKKISLEMLMDKVTDFTGEKIESKDVKNVVKNLGIELASEELEKLMKTLPTDAAGKLYHNRLMKSVKSLKKGKIKKNNLHKSLENMGVKLTEEEFAKLSKKLQVDANGNVDLHNLMEEVKVITGSVDIKNLETVLGNMGIKITNEELKDLTRNLPVSVDNKVSLKTLKDEVKAFAGEKIDSSNLQNVLKDMGIELTDKELEQLMKTLPIDGGKVHVSNLDTALEAMEVNLTEEELDHLKDLLSAYKKVDLKKVMDRIEDVTGEEVDVNDMETVLGNMGIELTDKELSGLVNNLPVDKGKVYRKRLLNGIKFLKGGKIDSSKVYTVLENMDMNLTEKELKDLTQNLPVDVNGKVDLEKVMNEVKPFSGDRVDTSKLENVLGNLGIKLTSNERLNLLETSPVNADGKVYQKRLMKGIKSLKRGNIDVNKLDTFLESMGIKITEEEFMDLIEKLPYDGEHCNHSYFFRPIESFFLSIFQFSSVQSLSRV
ncbi:EF-hand calcium-binding domain-containing protein 13 isoform X5 [Bubalus bubalis]|uniref:EF-hand calcium-binding domain-containing protein 13 isoform X5 n=1 Tax=Bubalus bubalis TaxID=89462 RepID=UPI001D0F928B|nr:EF-hand calcium-binding domain-containing protein 13 isoform X5 [Bubalus bubalis]